MLSGAYRSSECYGYRSMGEICGSLSERVRRERAFARFLLACGVYGVGSRNFRARKAFLRDLEPRVPRAAMMSPTRKRAHSYDDYR
jgi:hypothetical protein